VTARRRIRLAASPPITDVTTSDTGQLLASGPRRRAGDCSFSNAPLVLTKLTQRSLTAANSMYIYSGYSTRCGKSSAPYYDFTSTLGRLCVAREVEAKMDSGDGLVDGTVYWAHEIVAHGCAGGQRAGK
jgi:hypothetical protein